MACILLYKNSFSIHNINKLSMSQTLFGNPKGPIELSNPNTCAETKLCLILFRLRSSLL